MPEKVSDFMRMNRKQRKDMTMIDHEQVDTLIRDYSRSKSEIESENSRNYIHLLRYKAILKMFGEEQEAKDMEYLMKTFFRDMYCTPQLCKSLETLKPVARRALINEALTYRERSRDVYPTKEDMDKRGTVDSGNESEDSKESSGMGTPSDNNNRDLWSE